MNVQEVIQQQGDAVNRHDLDVYTSLYSPSAVVMDPMYLEPLTGQEAIKRDMSDFFSAFPDLEAQLIRIIGDENGYAIQLLMKGTHEGPLTVPEGTIQATHKHVEFGIGIFGRLDSQGRITEEHRYFDVAGILHQLGAIHTAGA